MVDGVGGDELEIRQVSPGRSGVGRACGSDVHVAFAIDVFSRKIVGWQASTSKETDLVLDAIDMGLQHRDYRQLDGEDKLIHHSDAGSQYTLFPVHPTSHRCGY